MLGSHRGASSTSPHPWWNFGDTYILRHPSLNPLLPSPHCHVTLSSHICLCPKLHNSAASPRLTRLCQKNTLEKKNSGDHTERGEGGLDILSRLDPLNRGTVDFIRLLAWMDSHIVISSVEMRPFCQSDKTIKTFIFYMVSASTSCIYNKPCYIIPSVIGGLSTLRDFCRMTRHFLLFESRCHWNCVHSSTSHFHTELSGGRKNDLDPFKDRASFWHWTSRLKQGLLC